MFNVAKYIGCFSSLARGSVHLVDKPGCFVEKHEKNPVDSAKITCQLDILGVLADLVALMQPPSQP